MSHCRCYITPFLESGEYGEEIEVTSDVDFESIGNVNQKIDNDEFNVGVLTYSDLDIKFRNELGKYSEPDFPNSIFRYKRKDSLFRLAWQIQNQEPICGLAIAGQDYLSDPETIFEGFLSDDLSSVDVKTHIFSTKVIGLESILSRIVVPYADISNGDNVSDILLTILDQTVLTDIITLDAANITVGFDVAIDDKTDLENKTAKEALDELLLISNSVFYIKDRVLYITSRDETADSQYVFRGPMATSGLENIQNISTIKTGINKMFNFWTFNGSTFSVQDAASRLKYGTKKKEVSSSLVTNTTKRQNILGDLVNEFGQPKATFTITAPITYDTLELFFLDKVNVDYPTVYIAVDNHTVPLYDVAKYDEDYYPIPESAITIESEREFKIMGVNINLKETLFEFELREV